MSDLIERLRSSQTLPLCPFERKSPEYFTTPNDQPCKFCGGLPEGPDKCTGADMRIMGEAADALAAKDAEIKAKDTQIRALEELHRDLKTIQRRIVGDTGLSAIETIDDLLEKFDAKHLAELTMEPSL